jgi:hypothetical protein
MQTTARQFRGWKSVSVSLAGVGYVRLGCGVGLGWVGQHCMLMSMRLRILHPFTTADSMQR